MSTQMTSAELVVLISYRIILSQSCFRSSRRIGAPRQVSSVTLVEMYKAEEGRYWPSLLPWITGYFFGRFGCQPTVWISTDVASSITGGLAVLFTILVWFTVPEVSRAREGPSFQTALSLTYPDIRLKAGPTRSWTSSTSVASPPGASRAPKRSRTTKWWTKNRQAELPSCRWRLVER